MGRTTQLVGAVLVAALGAGCATPAVHSRWLGRDRVTDVSVSLTHASASEVDLEWRVAANDGATRQGSVQFAPRTPPDCSVELVIAGGPDPAPLSPGRFVVISRGPYPPSTPTADPCAIAIFPAALRSNADPSFDIWGVEGRRGQVQTYPPRRTGWLALYPLAALYDTVAILSVVGGVIIFLEVIDSDWTWSPNEGVD